MFVKRSETFRPLPGPEHTGYRSLSTGQGGTGAVEGMDDCVDEEGVDEGVVFMPGSVRKFCEVNMK